MRSAEVQDPCLPVGSSTAIALRSPATSALSNVRRWTRTQLGGVYTDIDVVVTELVANAIKHGKDGGTVVVSLERRNDEVIVVVTNPVSADTPAFTSGVKSASPTSAGGRGLAIAKALSLDLAIVHRDDVVEVTAHIPCVSP